MSLVASTQSSSVIAAITTLPLSRSLICRSGTSAAGFASASSMPAFPAAAAAFIARMRAYFLRSSSSSTISTVPLPRSTRNLGVPGGGRQILPVRQSPVICVRSTSGAGVVLMPGGSPPLTALVSSAVLSLGSSTARVVMRRTRGVRAAPRRTVSPCRAATEALIWLCAPQPYPSIGEHLLRSSLRAWIRWIRSHHGQN